MNRQDVAKLLAYAAACDQRTVGEADLHAWFDILAPLDFTRCIEAMRKHYRERPDERLKPGHLWKLAKTTTGAADACEQGAYCETCKGVHLADEPCDVLTQRPETFAKALASFRRLEAS